MQRMQCYSYSSPTICYSDSDTLIFEWRQPGLGVTQDTKDFDSFPQLVLTQRMTVCVWSELPHRLLAIASSSKLNALQMTHDHNPSHKWFSHFLIDEGTLYFNPDLSDNTSPFPSMSHSCLFSIGSAIQLSLITAWTDFINFWDWISQCKTFSLSWYLDNPAFVLLTFI